MVGFIVQQNLTNSDHCFVDMKKNLLGTSFSITLTNFYSTVIKSYKLQLISLKNCLLL